MLLAFRLAGLSALAANMLTAWGSANSFAGRAVIVFATVGTA